VRFRIFAASVVAVPALLVLSACVFSPGRITAQTVDPEDIETLAEDALEDQTGQRPEIDCGEERIPVQKDREVSCLLVDPIAGLEFDTVITFTTVEGGKYTIDVAVAEVPNNRPEPTVEPDPGGDAPTVPSADIAALAIEALTPVLGFVPQIECPPDDVPIFVDGVTTCSFEDAQGRHDVEVTITAFDGESYTINAVVVDAE
jgi:hypothetical protein